MRTGTFLLAPMLLTGMCCTRAQAPQPQPAPPVKHIEFPRPPEVIQPEGTDVLMFRSLTMRKDGEWQHVFYVPAEPADECISVYWSADGVLVTSVDCGLVAEMAASPGHNEAKATPAPSGTHQQERK